MLKYGLKMRFCTRNGEAIPKPFILQVERLLLNCETVARVRSVAGRDNIQKPLFYG